MTSRASFAIVGVAASWPHFRRDVERDVLQKICCKRCVARDVSNEICQTRYVS